MRINKRQISHERLLDVLSYDSKTGVFTRLVSAPRVRAGSVVGVNGNSHGYAMIRVDKVQYLAHRLAWFYVFGVWPNGEIDHKNGIKTDNRIENLREANKSENQQNLRCARCNSKTGFLGVTARRGRYRATLGINGKLKFIGTFDTPEEAHQAYLNAKRAMHPFGEIALSE